MLGPWDLYTYIYAILELKESRLYGLSVDTVGRDILSLATIQQVYYWGTTQQLTE